MGDWAMGEPLRPIPIPVDVQHQFMANSDAIEVESSQVSVGVLSILALVTGFWSSLKCWGYGGMKDNLGNGATTSSQRLLPVDVVIDSSSDNSDALSDIASM